MKVIAAWRLVIVGVLARGAAVARARRRLQPDRRRPAIRLSTSSRRCSRGARWCSRPTRRIRRSRSRQGRQTAGATRSAHVNQLTANQIDGYDADTGKLVAKALGVEPCFVTPTWTEITAGQWGDRWDISYGSGAINTDRMKRLWMTTPYRAEPQRYFVAKSSPYMKPSDLDGKTIGVCNSCTVEFYLKDDLTIPGVPTPLDVKDPKIVTFAVEPPGLKALSQGKIDAYFGAEAVGEEAIRQGEPLRPLQGNAFTMYLTGFLDKSSAFGQKAFAARVDQIVTQLQKSGELKRALDEVLRQGLRRAARPITTSPSSIRTSRRHRVDRLAHSPRTGVLSTQLDGPPGRDVRGALDRDGGDRLRGHLSTAPRRRCESSVYQRLGAVADAKTSALDSWVADQQRNLVFIGTLPQVDQEADRLLSHGASSSQRSQSEHALQQQLASVVAHTTDAQELLLLSTKGAVAVSTVPGHAGKSQAKEQYFIQGLSHTAVENPYTSSLTGQPTITVVDSAVSAGRVGPPGRRAGRQPEPRADRWDRAAPQRAWHHRRGLPRRSRPPVREQDPGHRRLHRRDPLRRHRQRRRQAVGPGPLHQLPGRSGDWRVSLASRARRGHGG